MPSSAPPSLLDALRHGTAAAHAQLEAEVDIPRVCREPGSYRGLLERFYGFYRPFESRLRAIDGWEERGFSWEERSKLGFLEQDLAALGVGSLDELPLCTDLPEPRNLAEAFGCAYVLEGSTLGGRQISGILAQTEIPPEAQHFFHSYGAAVGPRWKAFCEMLGGFELEASAAEEVAAAAAQTFSSLGNWLRVKS